MKNVRENFSRAMVGTLRRRLAEKAPLIQVVLGPRQVGKSTAVLQAIARFKGESHYASADLPVQPSPEWITKQWNLARQLQDKGKEAVLVLDEVQKVPRWSEVVKNRWDEERRRDLPLKVVLLGSASLLIGRGLGESLAGRFEVFKASAWSLDEMQKAFKWKFEDYILYGAFPAFSRFRGDEKRWKDYVKDSLIETVLSRDILMMQRVDKPRLLRELFMLGCTFGGQALPYSRMLGQMTDAGNTTTLAHYLELLEASWLLAGLPRFSGSRVRQRASSPKWLPLSTAFMTALSDEPLAEWRKRGELWGRLVETAAGQHLYWSCREEGAELFWWREQADEVDFVVKLGNKVLAIEIKSGNKNRAPGLAAFKSRWPASRTLLVDGEPRLTWLLKSSLNDIYKKAEA